MGEEVSQSRQTERSATRCAQLGPQIPGSSNGGAGQKNYDRYSKTRKTTISDTSNGRLASLNGETSV